MDGELNRDRIVDTTPRRLRLPYVSEDDRRLLAQLVIGAVLVVAGAATAGLAIRAFLLASGIGQ